MTERSDYQATQRGRIVPDRRVRQWLYGVALAIFPLLIAYGLVTAETAVLWGALVGAVLVPGLAVVNTGDPDRPERDPNKRA